MKSVLLALAFALPFSGCVSPSRSPAQLRLWVACCIYVTGSNSNGLTAETIAVTCAASSQAEAEEQMRAMVRKNSPGANIVSLLSNPVGAGLIDSVYRANHGL